jgi:hypothetical protein
MSSKEIVMMGRPARLHSRVRPLTALIVLLLCSTIAAAQNTEDRWYGEGQRTGHGRRERVQKGLARRLDGYDGLLYPSSPLASTTLFQRRLSGVTLKGLCSG